MAIRYSKNKNHSTSSGGIKTKNTSNIFNDDKYSYIVSDSGSYRESKNDSNSSSVSFSLDVGGVIGPLFKVALAIVIGSFIFTGVWDNRFIDSQVEVNTTDYLYEVSNGKIDLPYDYNIKFINYDWTNKINQLNGLRNVFDISLFSWYDSEVSLKTSYTYNNTDYSDKDYTDFIINNTGPIYDYLYNQYCISPSIKYLIDNDYLVINSLSYDDNLLGKPLKSFSYLGITQSYYDELISIQYDSLLKSFLTSKDDLGDYGLYLRDKESYFTDNLLNVLVAPITIGVNLFYDIGVILSFIVTW